MKRNDNISLFKKIINIIEATSIIIKSKYIIVY